MKHILIYSISLFLAVNVNAQLKPLIADSKITSVTVFQNTAEITREAKINLHAGSNIISFEKLSSSISSGSVRVEGSDKYTIVSVNSAVNYMQEGSERPEVKVMKKELKRVQDEIALNQSYINVYQEQQSLLIANHVFKGENKGITVEDMLNMVEVYRNKLNELQDKIYDCEIKAKRMNTELSKIQQQVNEIETKYNRYTSNVQINLSAASAQNNVPVKITYLVNNASWSANYDAKAKDLTSPLELVLKATVVQTSGEDWNNVKLTLSTGNPNKNKSKPELAMWSLYAYDEVVYKSNRKGKANSAMRTEAYGENDIADYEQNVPGVVAEEKVMLEEVVVTKSEVKKMSSKEYASTSSNSYTQIIETGVNAEYVIDIPYTILSDGKENSVEIKKYEIPATYAYYAIPKLDKDAFLVSYITGWEKFNLIPGYVNVYINDTYNGRSWFDSQSVEDTLELSMGRDHSIIINRKKTKDVSGNAVIGGSRKSNQGYEISIRNSRKTPVKLFLYDQFPLSQFKEIEITQGETSGAKVDKENGKLEWEMDIQAGEDKKVLFNYSVKYPKEKTISNLGG
jgi:hypothetical protein